MALGAVRGWEGEERGGRRRRRKVGKEGEEELIEGFCEDSGLGRNLYLG